MALKFFITSQADGVAHLAGEGEATSTDFVPGALNPLEAVLGPGWNSRRVIVNMDQVTYLDSSAIGWLITSQKAFRAAGGYIVLHSLQPRVKQVLAMLRFERVVPLADNAEAAREMIAAGAIC